MRRNNKILIILDGSEHLENSVNLVNDTTLINADHLVLFLILNPFNPVTKSQQKRVLYNDYVHDYGRKLANLYIEKLEEVIHSKNKDLKITHNIVNSSENLFKRLSLGDIDLTLTSITTTSKLNYILNSKSINQLIDLIDPLMIIPKDFLYNNELRNNLVIKISEYKNDDYIAKLLNNDKNLVNLDKITFLYEKEEKKSLDQAIEELDFKTLQPEYIEIDSNISNYLMELKKENNLVFNYLGPKKNNFWDNFNKNSNYSFFLEKVPVIYSK